MDTPAQRNNPRTSVGDGGAAEYTTLPQVNLMRAHGFEELLCPPVFISVKGGFLEGCVHWATPG